MDEGGFIESAHSPLFNEIRSIPTGRYMRSPIIERVEKNESWANMKQDKLKKEIKNSFKGIFSTKVFNESMDIDQATGLPQIIKENDEKAGRYAKNKTAMLSKNQNRV